MESPNYRIEVFKYGGSAPLMQYKAVLYHGNVLLILSLNQLPLNLNRLHPNPSPLLD